MLVSWCNCSTLVDNSMPNSRALVLIHNLTSPEWGLLFSILVCTLDVCSWGWELRQRHLCSVPLRDCIWPITMAQLCSQTLVIVKPFLASRVSFWLKSFSGICCELRQFNNMWQDTIMMITWVTLKILNLSVVGLKRAGQSKPFSWCHWTLCCGHRKRNTGSF